MKLTDARILIVDDHQELCQMVRQICIQEGFCRIESALSCSKAEQILRQHPVDFLILDVNMPFEDGFSFFHPLRHGGCFPFFQGVHDRVQLKINGFIRGLRDK